MERRTEREWKLVSCPGKEERMSVMCEWDILSNQGRILKKTLRQIDCSCPDLVEFGGADCNWRCEEVIGKREK